MARSPRGKEETTLLGWAKDVVYVKELLLKSILKFHFTDKLVQKWDTGIYVHGWLPQEWSSPSGKWFLATAIGSQYPLTQ